MEYVSVMEPSHPVVAVHKGWLSASRAGDHEYGTETPTADLGSNTGPNETQTKLGARRFEFVNSSTGKRKRDPDAARLIRVHVRRNRVLDTTHKRNPPRGRRNNGPNLVRPQASDAISMKESFDQELRLRCQHGVYDTWQFSGSSTALCTWEYPINMLPRMHRLLETYLTYATSRMYPWHLLLRSNPLISSAWFRYAVTDAGMLHAMLYSGALYLALLEGKTETKDTIYHLNQTISIINKRLSISPHFVQDSTIGAITCLAIGSAVAGNQSIWRIHMRGLKEIVEKRGSLSSFDGILQAKIRRSDITGAIDYGAIPCLQLERSNRLSIWSKLPEQTLQAISSDVTRILTNCDIHADLITIMIALANFTQAIGSAIHDPEWDFDLSMCAEDMYWIEYRLLAFPVAHPNSYREKDVNKACRLGALIYIKATLEEFPHSKMGSSFLLEELRAVLHNLPIEEARLPLLLWLSLIGAAISKSPRDRERFVSYLGKLVANSSSSTFRGRELDLTRVLSTRLVLGSPVDRVWESVTGVVANTNIR